MSEERIADDEVLYRRIPPGTDWFDPPDRISSLNFQLRKGELGISVYRASVTSASDVLKRPGAIVGSRIARATAGQIRAAQDAKGDWLNLDVVPVNDETSWARGDSRFSPRSAGAGCRQGAEKTIPAHRNSC